MKQRHPPGTCCKCANRTSPMSSWYRVVDVFLYVPNNCERRPLPIALHINCSLAFAQCGASNRCGKTAPNVSAKASKGDNVPLAKMTECAGSTISRNATEGEVHQIHNLASYCVDDEEEDEDDAKEDDVEDVFFLILEEKPNLFLDRCVFLF